MSRSRRKTLIFGRTATSEKQDKRKANRILRRKVREGHYDLTPREVSNTQAFAKDGKHYWPDCPPKHHGR